MNANYQLFQHEGAADASFCNDVLASAGLGGGPTGGPIVLNGAADVLPFPGLVNVTTVGVNAMTLATPVAGPQQAGGDDGKIVTVIDTGGHAHTITTASNKLSPSHHIATFNGTVGSNVSLVAVNGVWYPYLTALGVTYS